MPLLIDCYNVLHAEKPASLAGLGEASLCAILAGSPWAKSGVTVVCDGRPKPHSPSAGEVGEVTLIFSGAGRSADDVMIELIAKDSAPRRLTVVSSDRAIRRAAGRRRARDWSSESFLKRLAKVVEGGRGSGSGAAVGGAVTPGKPGAGTMGDDQVERWLDWFGIDPAEGGESKGIPGGKFGGKSGGKSGGGDDLHQPKRDDFWESFGKDLEDFEDEFGD